MLRTDIPCSSWMTMPSMPLNIRRPSLVHKSVLPLPDTHATLEARPIVFSVKSNGDMRGGPVICHET